MGEALNVVMRWLHISSVAALVGGAFYGRWMMYTGLDALSAESRDAAGERAASQFRPIVFGAIGALLISGLYNIVSTPGHRPLYLLLLGVKLLLVAHIFAVLILAVRPKGQRRARLMAGAAISGFCVILISAYLRRIF